MASRTSAILYDNYKAVSGDIFKLCRAMGFSPTWQQEELLLAVQRAKERKGSNWIAAKSGQGPGKTAASVMIGLWTALQYTEEAGGARTIVTAPTMHQLRDVWLSECRLHMKRADDWLRRFINVTMSKVEIGGDPDWGIKFITASTDDKKAAGRHHKQMSVIVEEASGVPAEIITQYKGTLSNPDSLLVLIGNPNTRDCAFFDCFYGVLRGRWFCLTFNAEDTARDYPEIVSPQRNLDLAEEFGRDSDVYRIRVLGEFPRTEPNCVISDEDLTACNDKALLLPCARMERSVLNGGGLARQFGIDFARYGGDEATIFRRQGYSIVEWAKMVRRDPSETVDKAIQMQTLASWHNNNTMYVCDASGMGQGILHRLYQARKQVVEFHNGGTSTDKQYDNKVTEAWFHLSKLLRARTAYIPADSLMTTQLTSRRYYTNKKGKLVLESKDEYMKRGFDSPDRADGLVLSMYDKVVAVGNYATRDGGSSQARRSA